MILEEIRKAKYHVTGSLYMQGPNPTEPAEYSGSYTSYIVTVSYRIGVKCIMAMKLSTMLGHIRKIPNSTNASMVKDFYEYLKEIGTSENYQNQNLKQIIGFAKFLGTENTFHDVKKRNEIIEI